MTTGWVIAEATDRIRLDASGRGAATFTVTNAGAVQDRAVFDVAVDAGADRSWFTVDEAQRTVAPGASVTYVVQALVPPGTPAGSYTVQGRVYSADTAPEESSALSRRVTFDVTPSAPPPSKPWWLLAVVAAVVLVAAVAAFLLLRDGEDGEAGEDGDEPEAELVSSGTDILHGTFSFDFDAGIETQNGAEVFWQQQTQQTRSLVPRNGAQLANLGQVDFDDVSLADLEAAPFSADAIDGSDASDEMPAGTVLAVRTSDGNFAKVLIVERDVSDPAVRSIQNILIEWETFAPA